MTTVNQYQLYCVDEAAYVYQWDTEEPSLCPNNHSHTINPTLTTIVKTVSTKTVKAQEDSEGYFETGSKSISIPAGPTGTVTQQDVFFDSDAILWRVLLTSTADMVGDRLTVIAGPGTIIGVVTAPVSAGAITLSVNSTVTTNIYRGFNVVLQDATNTNDLGNCIARGSGTITTQNATVNSFSPGTSVKVGIYVCRSVLFTRMGVESIGDKGAKGKLVPFGTPLRVFYTNNSGLAKEFNIRYEIYLQQ